MGMKTWNQHFLPRFILKKWEHESNKIYCFRRNEWDLKTHRINGKEQLFSSNLFYEYDGEFDLNIIENELSKVESKYSSFQKEIEERVEEYKSLKLYENESIIIKLWTILQMARSKEMLYSLNNANDDKIGDELFTYIFQDNTEEENKKFFLYSVLDIIELLNYAFENKMTSINKKLEKMFESNIYATTIFSFLYSFMLKPIKAPNKSENFFLLNDMGNIEFLNPISRVPMFEYIMFSPKLSFIGININKEAYVNIPYLDYFGSNMRYKIYGDIPNMKKDNNHILFDSIVEELYDSEIEFLNANIIDSGNGWIVSKNLKSAQNGMQYIKDHERNMMWTYEYYFV